MKNIDIINNRKVINGEDDGLMQVSPLKHPFAMEIYQTMLKNTWVPQEVPMGPDVEMWDSLSSQEKKVFQRSLAFVSNLDGLQTNNLVTNICRHITSPEINLAIVRQAFEESLHVLSYATMIEALSLNPEETYGLYRKDLELHEKNKHVLNAVEKISSPDFKTGTFENDQLFLEACIGNIIIEGIYFYSAFLTFYNFKRNNKMPGSAEMIQFINRDEDMHLRLFTSITKELIKERPDLWTEEFQERIRKNIIDAVELELSWGKSCIGEGILGLNQQQLEQYLKFVGDVRLTSLGLSKEWGYENPFPWIEEYTQGSMIETNFFEATVREYSVGTLEWD